MRRLIPRLCAACLTFLAGVLAVAIWSPSAGFMLELLWGALLTGLALGLGTPRCFGRAARGRAKKSTGALLYTLLISAGGAFMLPGVSAALAGFPG